MVMIMLSNSNSVLAAGSAQGRKMVVGINHDFVWTEDAEIDPLVALLKESGATHVRIPIRWTTVEPKKGVWDFAKVDRVVRKLRDARIEILGVLMSFPGWANGTEGKKVEGWYDTYPPESDTEWALYIRKVASRYKKEIRLWEIWNEENGVDFFRPVPDAKRYVSLLKSAHAACKAANPTCTVLLGGLQMNGVIANPWSPVKTPDFLQAIYDAGGKPFFDVINIHPYVLPRKEEGAAYMGRLVEQTAEVAKKNGDAAKPIWITEIGCSINPVDTAEAQANLLTESYDTLAKIPQVKGVFWFTLRDYPQGICGGEESMGIATNDRKQKPAFQSYQQAVRKYATAPKAN